MALFLARVREHQLAQTCQWQFFGNIQLVTKVKEDDIIEILEVRAEALKIQVAIAQVRPSGCHDHQGVVQAISPVEAGSPAQERCGADLDYTVQEEGGQAKGGRLPRREPPRGFSTHRAATDRDYGDGDDYA